MGWSSREAIRGVREGSCSPFDGGRRGAGYERRAVWMVVKVVMVVVGDAIVLILKTFIFSLMLLGEGKRVISS